MPGWKKKEAWRKGGRKDIKKEERDGGRKEGREKASGREGRREEGIKSLKARKKNCTK